MKNILYAKPSVGDLEKQYVCDAIENGWGENCYDYIYKFQDSYKQYLNVKHAMATSSCTGAIHIALKAIGVEADDEVIVPDATWIASVAPITYLCANPVFVDVMKSTWCIDPKKIEEAITPQTKVIIAVHLYGNMCEMDEIMAIARKYNLYVIEDSAEAIGSEYKGQKAGSIGDFGVFSFHGTKTITTGEGGMLVTNNDALYEKAKIIRNYGSDGPDSVGMVGINGKMNEFEAAMGLCVLDEIDTILTQRQESHEYYTEHLKDYIQMQSGKIW